MKILNAYENFVNETCASDYEAIAERMQDPRNIDIMHAALGLSSEGGEVADALKKHVFYGKELDEENIMEECGDQLWYVTLALGAIGATLEQCIAYNTTKLCKRYPDGFSEDDAVARADKAE